MASKVKSTGNVSGLILPYAESERLRSQEGAENKFNFGWGYGDKTWYPFQRKVLLSTADEIGQFGGVGGGKSAVTRAFLIQGNPHLPTHNPDGSPIHVNISYMYHPGYYALVLRKNEKDLDQFIQEAWEMYEPYGIVYKNGKFSHPMGGSIVCGHMADQSAWQKYLGNQYVRIAIEEAPLIPELSQFEELLARLRTPFSEMRTQVILNGNYGGPGSRWVYDRFMNVTGEDGEIVKPGEIIRQKIVDPVTGETAERTRIWIFSTFKDNPKFRDSPQYRLILAGLTDPKLKAAYMEGTWNVFSGSYFGDVWRHEHQPHEPVHAIHVRKPERLDPWFSRAIGLDWGYRHEAAATWICEHGVTKQLHAYREMVVANTSSERLGYELALATRDELNSAPDHSITCYLSHDAFQRRDAVHSTVELIAQGIGRVLGPNAVHVPDVVVRQLQESYAQQSSMPTPAEEVARQDAISALYQRRLAGITLRIAPKASALGWQYIRDLLRWEDIFSNHLEFDPQTAMRILAESGERYQEYLRATQKVGAEILPKLVIWDSCPRLIDAIPRLQFKKDEDDVDPAHFRGRDSMDSLHYVLLGYRDSNPPEPFEAYRARRLNTALTEQPNLTTPDLIWINRHLEASWAAKGAGLSSFSIPRGGRRNRVNPEQGMENPEWMM